MPGIEPVTAYMKSAWEAFPRFLHVCAKAAILLLILLTWTACAPLEGFITTAPAHEPLTLKNIRLATPPAIAPDFQLATPPEIAPQVELAMVLEDSEGSEYKTTNTASPTSKPSETLTPTASTTNTITATPSMSPTASSTPVTLWPTWTKAPTSTRTKTPVPTSTQTSAPSTQPPPEPSATWTGTAPPSDGPPVNPSPTYTHTPSSTPVPSSCNPSGNAGYESTLIGLINDARQAQGLHPLSQQSQLSAAARVHSSDMACNDFISHTGSDGSRPADRVTAQGYSYSWVGENIFAGSSDPQTTFNWWMDSEPHRNNILHSNYTEIGIGYSYLEDSRYRRHYTAVFARPR